MAGGSHGAAPVVQIEPQLAGAIDAGELDHPTRFASWVAEEKFDGHRTLLYFMEGGGVRVISRGGSDVSACVPHIAEIAQPALAGMALDAEAIAPRGLPAVSHSVTSILGSSAPRAIALQHAHGLVRFVVFDIPRGPGGLPAGDLPLSDRRPLLEQVVAECLGDVSGLSIAVQWRDRFAERYDEVTARGGEGLVLKRLAARYVPGGRDARTWAKVKRVQSWEYVVTGFTPGKGGFAGAVGAIEFGYRDAETGTIVTVGKCSGMTERQRYALGDADIGRVIEVRGQSQDAQTLAIRHPRFHGFRDDLDGERIGRDGQLRGDGAE